MKRQTYHNTPLEKLANVCDMSRPLVVNCVGAVDDCKDARTQSVRNDYYLLYLINGSMNVELNGEKNCLKAGDILIIEPGTNYMYTILKDSGTNYIWVHFTGYDAENILKKYSLQTNKVLSCGQIGSMIDRWKKMFREFVVNDKFFNDSADALLREILISFSRHINKGYNGKRILKSVLYIHENFNKKLTVCKLSDMENMSESHYRAVFSKIFGESPTEYITSRRIEAAIELLDSTDKKMDEISSLVGYNDAFYFGRQFKKKTGMTPGKYRKSNRG